MNLLLIGNIDNYYNNRIIDELGISFKNKDCNILKYYGSPSDKILELIINNYTKKIIQNKNKGDSLAIYIN